jgi:hypothetical protein
MDPAKLDVAGALFTSLHRHIKIEGRQMPLQDMEGTGSVSAGAGGRGRRRRVRRAAAAGCAARRARPTPPRRRLPHAAAPPPAPQCFDITELSSARAGAHKPLDVAPEELPRWSRASGQYKCVGGGAQAGRGRRPVA